MTEAQVHAEIRAVLDIVEAAFARGTAPATLIPLWYEEDAVVVAEGEPGASRGMGAVLQKAENMLPELGPRPNVRFTIDDSVLASGNLAVALIDAQITPDTQDPVETSFRMTTVWRRGSRGWRIVREMFGAGVL